MRRILVAFLAAVLLALPAAASAPKLAGSYNSSLLEREFYVFHDGGKIMIYVAGAKHVDRIQFVLRKCDVRRFNKELTRMENAFADYKDNRMVSETRRLDTSFPPVQVRWRDLRWNGVGKHYLVPYGTQLPDGRKVITIGGQLRSGKSVKTYCLSFANIEEVEEFKAVLLKAKAGESIAYNNR